MYLVDLNADAIQQIGGKFVLPNYALYFKPRSGSIMMFNSSHVRHYTRKIGDLGS